MSGFIIFHENLILVSYTRFTKEKYTWIVDQFFIIYDTSYANLYDFRFRFEQFIFKMPTFRLVTYLA